MFKSVLSLIADILFLDVYFIWWLKSRRRHEECQACGALFEVSTAFSEERLPRRCLYCSTRFGWRYRPFEVEYLKFRRLRLVVLTAVVGVAAFVAVSTIQEQRLAACRAKPLVERLADHTCTPHGNLTAQVVDVKVFEEPQWRAVANERAFFGYFNGRRYLVDNIAELGGLKPTRLSPSGKWLLLDHGAGVLGIYPLERTPTQTSRLDLRRCQLNNAQLVDLAWSPDEGRVVLLAQAAGKRLVKLATLDTSDPNAIGIAICMDAYSLDVASVDWLDNLNLLYLIEQGDQKRVEIRSAVGAELTFSASFSTSAQLNNLRVSPQSRYATFTADRNTNRQLYWLDLTAQPQLYTAYRAYEVRADSFFSWVNSHQLVYSNGQNRLALLDLAERTLRTGLAASDPLKGQLTWVAWSREN